MTDQIVVDEPRDRIWVLASTRVCQEHRVPRRPFEGTILAQLKEFAALDPRISSAVVGAVWPGHELHSPGHDFVWKTRADAADIEFSCEGHELQAEYKPVGTPAHWTAGSVDAFTSEAVIPAEGFENWLRAIDSACWKDHLPTETCNHPISGTVGTRGVTRVAVPQVLEYSKGEEVTIIHDQYSTANALYDVLRFGISLSNAPWSLNESLFPFRTTADVVDSLAGAIPWDDLAPEDKAWGVSILEAMLVRAGKYSAAPREASAVVRTEVLALCSRGIGCDWVSWDAYIGTDA